MRSAVVYFLTLVLLSVAGCHWIFPYGVAPEDGPASPERAPASDQMSREAVVSARDNRSEKVGPPLLHVTSAYDTCGSPATIDLASLPVSFTVDTSGGHEDHLSCFGAPDVVIRFTHSPGGSLSFCCAGGGNTCGRYNSVPSGGCPPSQGVGWAGNPCSGCMGMGQAPQGDFFLIFARSPAAVVATITIARGQ